MLWYAVMLVALPLLILPQWRALRAAGVGSALWSPKVRSWWTVMGSSLATYAYQSIEFYLMICLIGAALVLAYRMTNWQKFLGWVFIAMAGLNLGYLLGVQNSLSAGASLSVLASYQHLLGWGMVLALYAWGGYDWLRGLGILSDILDVGSADTVEPAP